MPFCSKCGTTVTENDKFCPKCGTPTAPQQAAPDAAAAPVAPNVQPAPGAGQQNSGDFTAQVAALNNTADTTAEFDPADIASNKAMAILSYFGLLVLIPLLAAKNSRFARFHANQGLIVLIAGVVGTIGQRILGLVLKYIPYIGGVLAGLIGFAVSAVLLVLAVLGIINAAQGKAKELPVIGKFRLLK